MRRVVRPIWLLSRAGCVFGEAASGALATYCQLASDGVSLPVKSANTTARAAAVRASEEVHQGGVKVQEGAVEASQRKTASVAALSHVMDSVPDHHVTSNTSTWGARFTNPWSTWRGMKGWGEVMAWSRQRKKLGKEHSLDGWLEGKPFPTSQDFQAAFPLNAVDWAALANPPADAIQALWVGHATVLVQMGGLTFITDPCLFERCAPVQWAGPKRVVPAAFQADAPQLPNLDFVLLSHNHYDHLDSSTVKALYKRFGDALTWYVPLGVKAWFKSAGIRNVVELDWWQEVQHQGSQARITFVPAQHWSARGVLDRLNTLWGGFVVKTQQPREQTFYFAGDTGYCPVFTEIGKRLGPMDLSAIPIGAYEPRWFMAEQHVDAEEGLQIHHDVRSKRSMAIHCCTWALTDEALDEPPRRLAAALASSGGDPQEFVTLQHGALLQVRDGKTLNAPKTLGPQLAGAATVKQ